MKEDVIRYIQEYFLNNVFDISYSPNRNRKFDNWKQSWLDEIGTSNANNRSRLTIIRLQEAVQNHFGASNVFIEEPLQSVIGNENNGHRLDLYIPSERAAIEICLSAIKNEFEKDILKGMLDHRVTTLYVMARDYVTGTAETKYGINTMQQPSSRSIIEMVSVFKLEVIPTQICPIL